MKLLLTLLCALGTIMTAAQAANPGRGPRVALVFDDGPEPVQGSQLQALLAQEGVRVTFAHVGRNVRKHPEVTRAAAEAGHEIVNHSETHARIAELSTEEIGQQIAGGQDAILSAIGKPARWYWPPYLAVDARLLAELEKAQLAPFRPHALVDSKDWDVATTADQIRAGATQGVRDGTVILFHEWRKESREQLPAILAELRRQGCVLMTFSELAEELRRQPPAEPADPQMVARFNPGAAR